MSIVKPPTTTNPGGMKEGLDYVISQFPQRSLTKQALKRLFPALSNTSPLFKKTIGENSTKASPRKSPPLLSSLSGPSSSSTKTQNQPPKKVAFSEKVRVHWIFGRHQLSWKERALVWYDQDELFDIFDECYDLVEHLSLGRSIECTRGLERLTQFGRKQMVENRRSAVQIVLCEQDRQALVGTFDDDYTAFLYRSASSNCLCWSTIVGHRDQKEAELVYNESDTRMRLGPGMKKLKTIRVPPPLGASS